MKWYQMRWAQKYWGKEARERYQRYLQSDAWKTKRKAVLQAAGFRCRRCGAPATEVHHETYKRIYKERMSDLTALCSKCHEGGHPNLKRKVLPKRTGIGNLNNASSIENASERQAELWAVKCEKLIGIVVGIAIGKHMRRVSPRSDSWSQNGWNVFCWRPRNALPFTINFNNIGDYLEMNRKKKPSNLLLIQHQQ